MSEPTKEDRLTILLAYQRGLIKLTDMELAELETELANDAQAAVASCEWPHVLYANDGGEKRPRWPSEITDSFPRTIGERAQAQADEEAIQAAVRACVKTAPEPIAAE